MVRIMFVTFAALGWSWYALSGGGDFVPGGQGVSIVAHPNAARDNVEPNRADLAGIQPTMASFSAPGVAPRVTTLGDRSAVPAKSVAVTPVPASVAANMVTRARTVEIEQIAPPVDQITLALAAAIPAAANSFDPAAAPVQRIAGLGSARPLGTPLDGALVTPVAVVQQDLRIVSGSRVNLRGGPATTYSVVTKLGRGDEVEVLDDTGDGWVKLRLLDDDTTGWMSDDFLTASN